MNRRIQRALARILIFLLLSFWPRTFFAQTSPNRVLPSGLPSGVEKILKPGNENNDSFKNGSTVVGASGGQMSMGMENQVHVLGQVRTPGTYRVGTSVRVAEAVATAGGVSEHGSLRNIEIRRPGLSTTKTDLLSFYEKGDLNTNPFLQDNDVIFVPYRTKSVRIEGPVKKSGVYELANETHVWDIVQLAGGFTVGASQQGNIAVVRYEEEKKKVIQIPNVVEELRRTPIQNGDIIVVPHIFTKNNEFDYAFPNLPSDSVFYPSYNDQIYVAGAVLKAGAFEYQGYLTAMDYVNMAGPDPTRANIKGLRVVRPDGKAVRKIKKYNLNPGDTILVPDRKITGGHVLGWYTTFASTLFSYVSLRALLKDL